MKLPETIQRVEGYLAERFPVDKLNYASMVQKKEVPVHRLSWGYYLGGLALFFFIVQVVTGLMLLFYYQPTVSDAHASVEFITEHVPGGALVRNIHAWASSLMIASVMFHLLTAFAMKAFARPREMTWVTGVFLLGIAFAFGFTGYLLPWHQIAVNATKIGMQTIEQMGAYLPGELATWPRLLKEAIQGEATVGQATLSRFFALHVIVLPMVVAGTLGAHLLSVQLHGMSRGVDEEPRHMEKFFPYPLFEPFDPKGSTPDGIKPEWYFFWVYYPLELLPFWVIIVGSGLLGGVLLATPWIFRNTSRRTLQLLAIAAGGYLVIMTVFGSKIYELFKP